MAKTIKMGKLYPHQLHEDDYYEDEDDYEEEEEEPYEDEEEYEEDEDEDEYEEEEVNAEQNKEEKPQPKQNVEAKSVTVKVKKEEKGVKKELVMKIDKDVELRWLMIHYCNKLLMNYASTKFMFNGAHVRETDTAVSLSMLDNDVIYAVSKFPVHDARMRTEVCYKTLCIRMHKRRDTFMRVTCLDPLLPQLKRHFSFAKAGKCASTCFVYKSIQLSEGSSVFTLNLDDGDIIDAFDFEECSSSLSVITPSINPMSRPLTLNVETLRGRGTGDTYPVRVNGSTPLKVVAQKYANYTGRNPEKIDLYCSSRRLSLNKTVDEEHLCDGSKVFGLTKLYF